MTEGIEYIAVPPAAGGEGVTDHGALTGLADDDHPQYETSAEAAAKVTTHEAAADPHPGYLLESLLDAKGDLYMASAADTPARLAVGTAGQVLVADPAGAGLKWATTPNPGKLWLPSSAFVVGTGAAATGPGTQHNQEAQISVAEATDGGAATTIRVPDDYGSGLAMSFLLANSAAGGNVAFACDVIALTTGTSVYNSGGTLSATAALAMPASGGVIDLVASPVAIPTNGTAVAGGYVHVGLRFPRTTDAATDTSTGTFRLFGVLFTYTRA